MKLKTCDIVGFKNLMYRLFVRYRYANFLKLLHVFRKLKKCVRKRS